MPESPQPNGLNEDLTRAIQQSTTVKEIEDIVRYLVSVVNLRQLDVDNAELRSFVDPRFCAVAVPPFRYTFEQYLAHLNDIVGRYPDYYANVTNIDIQIETATGNATVLMDFELTGVPVGVVRRSVAVMRFRRGKKGRWQYFEYQATDGIEES